MVAAMAVLLVTFALEVKSSSNNGAIGVGLIAILGFNDALNRLIIEWTTLETSLGAIARLKKFNEEAIRQQDEGSMDGFRSWPETGEVKFIGAEAKYRCIFTSHVKGGLAKGL